MGMKKKLSKKEKARMEAEQAELLRIEMEKEKQRKLEEDRKRKQHEREEAEKRQKLEIIENRARRTQLKESVCYFTEIRKEIDRIKDDAKRQNEWERYMRCNGLPSANNPGDLRKYIHMWNTSILSNKAREQNWLLKTNERTILSQDKTKADLTRENLRKCQPNLGDLYSQRIQEVLGVLSELNLELESSEKLLKPNLDDLKHLKWKIRSLLGDFIDDFTFRVLSHVERDMERSTLGMSEHIYESSVFRTQVWMIQADASKPNNKDKFKENNSHTEINFPLLKLHLTLPQSFKLANSAIRSLWVNYDHFSDYCPSFIMPCKPKNQLNILQQTKKEWKKRKEILQSTLEQVTKETQGHTFDSIDEPQTRVVDVDKIYTEYEDEINKARRKSIGPEALDLSEFDVNLRSHRIVGGLYCIDYLDQPQQDKRLNNSSFIRSRILPDKLKRKGFYQPYKPPPAPQPGVRRLPEEIEAEMKAVERNLDKLATITLELPDTVLWFEPPIVCHWETLEEALEAENNSLAKQRRESRKSDVVPRKKSLSRKLSKPSKIVQDFDMYNIPTTVDIFGVMVDFVVPRLPDGFCIAIEYSEAEHVEESTSTSVVSYMTKSGLEKKHSTQPKENIRPMIEQLKATNSPRALHFDFSEEKILQVKLGPEFELDHTSEERYMFSQLIEDLEQLCEKQMPAQYDFLKKINSKASSARSSKSEEVPSRRFSNVIILREADIPKKDTMSAKLCTNQDKDSSSEYEDEPEEEEESFGDEVPDGFPKERNYGRWSTRDVHDTKFNEDKLSIQFRTGRLGYFGFAANRYSNIPYQTWELKPDFKSPIIFTITAAVISLEIQITSQGYRVNAFQGGTTDSLTEMIGHFYSLENLKRILTNAAVDIFPEEDAFCYTEGSCEKNYIMERHLYACMASLGLSHNFSWSRWNLLSGSRAAVLLIRELQEAKKVPNHSTLYVTPLRASIVDCTEVSASFSTNGVPGMQFYADLFHLAQDHILPVNKVKQATMDPLLRDNIYQILHAVRPLSFC